MKYQFIWAISLLLIFGCAAPSPTERPPKANTSTPPPATVASTDEPTPQPNDTPPSPTGLPTATATPEIELGSYGIVAWKWFYSDGVFSATALAWSPVDNILAIGQKNGNVLLWDVKAGELIDIFVGHKQPADNLAWSSDGVLLASASSQESTIFLWDIEEGKRFKSLPGHNDGITYIKWSSSNSILLSASMDKTIKFWDIETGSSTNTLTQEDNAPDVVAWSPDEKHIASSDGLYLNIWDASTGEIIQKLELPSMDKNNPVYAIHWAPDGSMLAATNRACCNIENTRVWSTQTWEQIGEFDARILSWSSDSQYLIYANGFRAYNGASYVWNMATNETITLRDAAGPYYDFDWTYDSDFVVAADRYTATIYHVESWENAKSLQENYGYGDKSDFQQVLWSHDNTYLAARDTNDLIVIWRTLLDTHVSQPATLTEGSSDWINTAAWSPDGDLLARAEGNVITLWDIATDKKILTLETGKSEKTIITSITWSPDGLTIVGADRYGSFYQWEVDSGKRTQEIEGHDDWVYTIAYSPDGLQLASVSEDQTLKIWDADTWETLHKSEGFGSAIISLAWSPDGNFLASGTENGTVDIWGTTNATGLYSIREHDSPVHSLSWSSDSQRLAAGSGDQDIILINPSTKEIEQTLRGTTLTWSPDDRYMVTGMKNGDIVLWDANSGEFLDILSGHTRWVYHLIWSPDGIHLFSGSRDGYSAIWEIRSDYP